MKEPAVWTFWKSCLVQVFQNSLDRLSGCNLDGCSLHAAGSPGCFMSGLKKQVSTADLFCVISLVQRRTALASKPSGSYRC